MHKKMAKHILWNRYNRGVVVTTKAGEEKYYANPTIADIEQDFAIKDIAKMEYVKKTKQKR